MKSITDRMSALAGGKPAAAPAREDGGGEGGGHFQIHDHGDGSFHSITKDGQQTEHPHVGHLAVHVAAHHEPDAKHMHVMQGEDGQVTTHQASGGGEAEGPHDHENLEEAKESLDRFFTEEERENASESSGGEHESSRRGLFE